jgi:hypothetical protein
MGSPPKGSWVHAWFTVCLDGAADVTVTDVSPAEGSLDIADFVLRPDPLCPEGDLPASGGDR